MKFYQLTFQNVRGNWHNYKIFFLSSCFSVFAFFMYTSIILHPYMKTGDLYKGVQSGLIVCDVIVIAFSIIFILYSSSIFIQSRKKEFGLFILMGATKVNVICMMIMEQLAVGLIASFAGIGIGLLFLKLFFMIFSLLLNMPDQLSFIFSLKAVVITIITYVTMFLLLSIFSALRIWKIEIIHLLKEIQEGKKETKSKKWLWWFGFVCIGIGYGLTTKVTMMNIALYFIPVSILTTIGTYFVCTHGTIQVLQRIKNRKSVMYQYPYLFVVNQLLHTVKDNRRFFFILSMLTTIVVTATGSVYLFFLSMKEQLRYNQPHAFSYVEKGIGSKEVMEKETVENLFRKHGVNDFRYATFVGIPVTFQLDSNKESYATVISEDEYNREANRQSKQLVHPKEGTVTFVYYGNYDVPPRHHKKYINFKALGEIYQFAYNGAYEGNVFNTDSSQRSGRFLVMHNQDFQKLSRQVPDHEKYVYSGYELRNWENREKLGEELQAHISKGKEAVTRNNVYIYKAMKDGGNLILFIGSFISVLFFLASCSTVYFKWFHNIEYDRMQYQALLKIGMTKQEIYKISRWQLGVLFFFPVLLGSIHSAVALHTYYVAFFLSKSFGLVLEVIAVYLIACILYFFFAQKEYMKHIG
ncbi:FtsX-like permease family protein [Bacillus sp. S14(2024)]|uniref:ABC transporter permease n=1 Tax=Bacillus sp. S14(2024) TaxID=3162884 RepID=UPI003D23DBC6